VRAAVDVEDSMSPGYGSVDKTPNAKWTVMVFMGAAPFRGSPDLTEAANADLQEMASVASGEGLKVYVQIHGIGTPRFGKVTGSTTTIGAVDEQADLIGKESQGDALRTFIQRSLYAAEYNPADPDYTMLVLWGHAYDFAIGRQHAADGTIDALDFNRLSEVLERLRREFKTPDAKLDILGFDACDAATVETACQLHPYAKYLVASQIGVPVPGWPYDLVLRRLKQSGQQDRPMLPMELGSWIVRRFCESYSAATDTVSLTLLDLERVPELSAFTNYLAMALTNASPDARGLGLLDFLFSQSQTSPGEPYVDVADLCLTLARQSADSHVVAAATWLGDFLVSPVPSLGGTGQRPFVVEHGRNAGQTARLNGISIYAPNVAPDRDFESVRLLYERLTFAKQTNWSDLVHALAALR
jgi:hypothetical protein